MCFPRFDCSKRPLHNFFINRSKLIAGARKEARDHRESVPDCRRARGTRREWLSFSRQTIKTLAPHTVTANGPQGVAKMLLQQRDFCLHCELDVLEVCV